MQAVGTLEKPEINGFQRTFRYLGDPANLSWSLFAFFFVLLSFISFLTDVISVGLYSGTWFLVSGAAFIPPLLIGITYRSLVAKKTPGTWSLLTNLLAAAAVGASRNLSVGLFAYLSGLNQTALWTFRLVGGGFMGISIYALWATAMGSKRDYLRSLDRLSQIQFRLSATRQQIPSQLTTINLGLQERTKNSLFPQIQAIRELLTGNPNIELALETLRATITDQIRPMMDELSNSQPKPFELKNIRKFRSLKDSMPERFTLKDKINVVWTSIFGTLGTSIWLWTYKSQNGLLDAIPLFTIFMSVMFLFKVIVPKDKLVPRFNAIVYTLAASLLASLANVFYIFLVLGVDQAKSIMFAGLALLGGTISALNLMLYAVRTQRRQEIESAITAELTSIAKENSLFAQRVWVFRKRWLLVLHGSVQSALTAALSRLQSSKDNDQVAVELVKQDLHRAELAVERDLSQDVDFETSFNELKAVWAGICNIEIQVSERAKRAISRSQDSSFCVNEILKEAVSNAVRHGEATEASVQIDRISDDILQIQVTNNGIAPDAKQGQGIGSEMLTEICLHWELISDKKSVRLVAELPVKL